MRLTEQVHANLRERLRSGDFAIDATVGNGHDTVLLAELVEPRGNIHGFDIQQEALLNTRQLLELETPEAEVVLHLAGHETMDLHLPPEFLGNTTAVVFNLGYLPGSDKSRATKMETSLSALKLSWEKYLRSGGILSVLCYPDHPGGKEETEAVAEWFERLEVDFERHPTTGPVLFLVTKPLGTTF